MKIINTVIVFSLILSQFEGVVRLAIAEEDSISHETPIPNVQNELPAEETNTTQSGSGSEITPTLIPSVVPTDETGIEPHPSETPTPDVTDPTDSPLPTNTEPTEPSLEPAVVVEAFELEKPEIEIRSDGSIVVKIVEENITGKADGEILTESEAVGGILKSTNDFVNGDEDKIVDSFVAMDDGNSQPANSDLSAEEQKIVDEIATVYNADNLFTVKIDGEELREEQDFDFVAGSVELVIKPFRMSEPGKKRFTIQYTNPFTNQIDLITQDFYWGVLAMNTDKDVYQPGESANVAIGILDQGGIPVCGLHPNLSIDGKSVEVKESEQCKTFDSQNIVADYNAKIPLNSTGEYKLFLSVDNGNGIKKMTKVIRVVDSPDFVVSRSQATRLFPFGSAPASFSLTFNKDFSGSVVERVPSDFELSNLNGGVVVTQDFVSQHLASSKKIVWKVDAEAGEIIKFNYTYDAPDESPMYFTVGSVELEDNDGNIVYTESQLWGIANDAASISGTVYTDEGITNIGANKTVTLDINGVISASDDTDSSGVYTITGVTINANDIVTLYLNDETEKAVTVTKHDGSTVSGFDLYQNHLIIRSESGAITNANVNVSNNSGDSDITALYTVAGGGSGNAVTIQEGYEMYLWAGDSWTAGDNLLMDGDLDVRGTLDISGNSMQYTSSGIFNIDNAGTLQITTSASLILADNITYNQGNESQPNLAVIVGTNSDISVVSNPLSVRDWDMSLSTSYLRLNGYNFTVTNNFSIGGDSEVQLYGTETLSFTQDYIGGIFRYTGDNDGVDDVITVQDIDTGLTTNDYDFYDVIFDETYGTDNDNDTFIWPANTYLNALNDITINSSSTVVDAFDTGASVSCYMTSLNVTGNFDGCDSALEIGSSLNIYDGTFDAPNILTFPNSSGTLNMDGGTFNGGSQIQFANSNATTIAVESDATFNSADTTYIGNTTQTVTPNTVTFDLGSYISFDNFIYLDDNDSTNTTWTTTAGTSVYFRDTTVMAGLDANDMMVINSSSPGTEAYFYFEDAGIPVYLGSIYVNVTDNFLANTGTANVFLPLAYTADHFLDPGDVDNPDTTITSGGNTLGWIRAISGTVYIDDSNLPEGTIQKFGSLHFAPFGQVTVTILHNGTSVGTDTTNDQGMFVIDNIAVYSPDDTISVYISSSTDDPSSNGVSVFKYENPNFYEDFDIYENRLLLRSFTTNVVSNNDLDTAHDNNAKMNAYYADGGGNTITTQDKEVYVFSGTEYDPGGISTFGGDMDVNGTFDSNVYPFSLAGDLDVDNAGTFTHNNLLTLNGTAAQSYNQGDDQIFNYVAVTNISAPVTVVTNPLNISGELRIINSDSILYANGKNISASTLVNNGTFRAVGSETLTFTQDINSGTFEFVGDGTGAQTTHTLPDFGATDYFNLVINDSSASNSDTFQLASGLKIDGDLTVTDSTLDFNTQTVELNESVGGAGDLTISSAGNITATSAAISVDGDWTNIANGFSAGSSTVTLTGLSQTIYGTTTFATLSKTLSSIADTIYFEESTTTSINTQLKLDGASGFPLTINSTTGGVSATINMNSGATWAGDALATDGDYLIVQDNTIVDVDGGNAAFAIPVDPDNSTDNFNTTGWFLIGISGNVYTDKGVTLMGSNRKVRLLKNGVDTGLSGLTDSSGYYEIDDSSITVNAGDILTVYLDDNTENGVTVFSATGPTMSGIDIYQEYAILRSDNGGTLALSEVVTGIVITDFGTQTDDISTIVSETGFPNNLSFVGAGLYIPFGHSVDLNLGASNLLTFNDSLTGNVTTGGDLEAIGVVDFGATDIDIAGNWNTQSSGFFTTGGTVEFLGTIDQTIATNTNPFEKNIIINNSPGKIVSLESDLDLGSGNFTLIDNVFYLNGYGFGMGGGTFNLDSDQDGDGTLRLNGSEGASFTNGSSQDFDSGTWEYIGDNTGSSHDLQYFNPGIQDYYNLLINDTNTTPNTYMMLDNAVLGSFTIQGGNVEQYDFNFLTVNGSQFEITGGSFTQRYLVTIDNTSGTGNLLISGGTFIGGAVGDDIDIDGNFVLSSGSFTSTQGNFNIDGNFTHASGTFAHNSGIIELTGDDQSVSGSTTFATFIKNPQTGGSTITFDDASTFTFNTNLELSAGGGGQTLTIRSDNTGSASTLNIVSGATVVSDHLDIKDNTIVDVDTGNGAFTTPVNPANSVNSGNAIGWFVSTILSGTVYTDEGITNIGANKTVRLIKNGSDTGLLDETDASGVYQLDITSLSYVAGDLFTVYIDDETEDGVTVTTATGSDMPNVDIYQNYLIIRSDNGGSITNANLNTAQTGDVSHGGGVPSATDVSNIFTVSGGTLMTATGIELFIFAGATYTPGGNMDLGGNLDNNGTLTLASEDVTIEGNWDNAATATFNSNNSDVIFDGTGPQTITSNGDAFYTVENQNITSVVSLVDNFTVNSNLAIFLNSVLYLSGHNITVSTALSNEGTLRLMGNETTTLTQDINSGTWEYVGDADGIAEVFTIKDFGGTDYYNLLINDSDATSDTFQLTSGLIVVADLTVTDSVLNLNSQTTDVNDDLIIGANGSMIAGASNITLADDWTNSGIFTAGTSTVTLDANSDHTIFGNTTFNNLTLLDSLNNSTDITLTIENGMTQTINGVLTIDGLDTNDRVNLRSDLTGATATFDFQGSGSFSGDFLDIDDSIATDNSTGVTLPINPTNSVGGSNTSGWFGAIISVEFANSLDTSLEATASPIFNLVVQGGNTVGYGVQTIGVNITGGSASSSGVDYTLADPITINIPEADYTVAQTISIPLIIAEDVRVEGSETISMQLENPTTFVDIGDADGSTVIESMNIFTITDNDTAAYTVTPSVLNITEGSGLTFDVVLTAAPIGNVVFTITSSNTTDGTVSVSTVTFTPLNWAVVQTVTVTAVNDIFFENGTTTITISVNDASSEDNWDPLADQTVSVTVTNEDIPGNGDVDGDGIIDSEECSTAPNCEDTDGDLIPDYKDIDSDNDGFTDTTECAVASPCPDSDGDGTKDFRDTDSDDDGILDSSEGTTDDDGDGITNRIDPANSDATNDDDGDGIEDDIEALGFNGGDGNGDGIQDHMQSNVTSVINPVTGEATTMEVSSGGCNLIDGLEFVSEDSLGVLDASYDYPYGLVDFTLDCSGVNGATGTVNIYYPEEYTTTRWVYRKFNGTTYSTLTSLVTATPVDLAIADFTYAQGSERNTIVTRVSYVVKDGDVTDTDTLTDAFIKDPSGPATPTSTGGGTGGHVNSAIPAGGTPTITDTPIPILTITETPTPVVTTVVPTLTVAPTTKPTVTSQTYYPTVYPTSVDDQNTPTVTEPSVSDDENSDNENTEPEEVFINEDLTITPQAGQSDEESKLIFNSSTIYYLVCCILSGLSILLLIILLKRRKDEEEEERKRKFQN